MLAAAIVTCVAHVSAAVAGFIGAEAIERPLAVPVDVMVTDCVAGVFRLTVPKATLLLPMVSVGVVAFRVSAKFFATPAELAVSVAV